MEEEEEEKQSREDDDQKKYHFWLYFVFIETLVMVKYKDIICIKAIGALCLYQNKMVNARYY